MKYDLENQLSYALLAILALAVFYGIYFAKMLAQKGVEFKRGKSDAGKKNPSIQLKSSWGLQRSVRPLHSFCLLCSVGAASPQMPVSPDSSLR